MNITQAEWEEMAAIKNVINMNPASVSPQLMERFSELYVKTLPRQQHNDFSHTRN